MWFDIILVIAFFIIIVFQGCLPLLPLGREDSTFRRIPWVTFSILAVNVIVYFVCLPVTVQQNKVLNRAMKDVDQYLEQNAVILADDRVRSRLREVGPYRLQIDAIEEEIKADPQRLAEYKVWLRSTDASKMRSEVE